MKKRILFLMSDTGGGHRAAAEAIDEAIHYLYPDTYDTIIEDLWKEHTPWPVNRIPDAYPWMAGPGVPMWKLMWAISTTMQPLPHKFVFPGVSPVLRRRIVRYFQETNPDLIVSVHPLMNHLAVRLRDKAGLSRVPFMTVVTDMVSVHPTWICPEVTLCTVPTNPARDLAIHWGMRPEQVVVTGQPVALKFSRIGGDKVELKRRLGLAPDRKTVLVVGGGEGMGPVFKIARAIARTASQAQLMVVAGRNRQLKTQLEAVNWEIPAKIFGFVKNMPDLMGAADILVTKAGPGTISEAFIARLPLILYGYIPGQETGNVTYVQERNAGILAEDPHEIGRLVRDWLGDYAPLLQQMTRNAASLARPQAVLDIARHMHDLIEAG